VTSERAGTRYARMVERLVIHGAPVAFRELCRRAVPQDTRYLILDLDRTVHLGRNMGELLGWELCARDGYGPDRLAGAENRRRPGRFFFDWSRPASVVRYLAVTARMWALPGLFYLVTGKLAAQLEVARLLSFTWFGPEPVSAVQRLPQIVLMHHLSRVPVAELRMLAHRVWDRYRGDQVIEREDLMWLRSRCPGIRIVLTSASPRPSVEVAGEALAVDDVIWSSVEEHAGRFSSPYQLERWLLMRAPHRIAGPGQLRINSGRAKIDTLIARYPDLADPGVVSVGISDTGYGEDHCWAEHLTRVIDVNSSAPFPPVVPAASPLREIHSAAVLTRSELARRASSDAAYLDPRRAPRASADLAFTGAELEARAGRLLERAEALARRLDEHARSLARDRRLVLDELKEVEVRLDAIAAEFNEAARSERGCVMRRLRRELRRESGLRRRLARLDRPRSRIAFTQGGLLASSRAALDPPRS
jgi:hypothetical protein